MLTDAGIFGGKSTKTACSAPRSGDRETTRPRHTMSVVTQKLSFGGPPGLINYRTGVSRVTTKATFNR